jgi:hypothetical protein
MKRRASAKVPIIITEGAYARAAIAAEMEGMSIAEYTEACFAMCVPRTVQRHREHRFAEATRYAIETNGAMPLRWEYGLGEQPFVRRQRSASENQAGRPSSRHHQEGRGAQAGSTAPKAGPERPGATHSAASMARTREDPPVDAAKHHGTRHPLSMTP